MSVELNHTIVPARDKEQAAQFVARIFGFRYEGVHHHFVVVRVNDALTLDFDERGQFESHHYAFKVDEARFDDIMARITAEGVAYGSLPYALDNRQVNHRRGGRGVYFRDREGHVFEALTA